MTRTTVTRAVVATLLGALLLGGASALLALRHYPTYQATLQLRIQPDPRVGVEVARGDDDAQAFLASEIVVLNGPELRSSAQDLIADEVAFTARTEQVGLAPIVSISATAPTREQARAGADTLAARYAGRRKADLLERVSTAQEQVSRQLAATDARIAELAGVDGVTADIQRAALTSEYSRLIALQADLELAVDASRQLVIVVKPAEVGGVPQVVDPVTSGLRGAVLGAALGLTAGLVLARWRRRVDGLDDLLDLAPGVALPTMQRVHGDDLPAQAALAASTYVSTLTAKDGGFARSGLVVVAPRPGAGATFVAVAVAVASARRQPTVLLALGDVLDGGAAELLQIDPEVLTSSPSGQRIPTGYDGLSYVSPTGTGAGGTRPAEVEPGAAAALLAELSRGGATVVVDAPALSESGVGLDLARDSGQALLVGGVDHTRAEELEVAAASLRRVGADVAGVVLSTPTRRRSGRSGR